MNFRDLLSKLDNIVEAADPQLYADAQAMMANLEKAAQYSGDDEIIRSRMGLPPKLPPIEQWDGKMPAPIGKPDWFARLTTLGKATDDQAVAVKRNAAIGTSREFITTNMAKLKELVDKLKATMASSQPQAVKESIARNLIESFGYTVEGFNDSAEDLIRQRAATQAAAAPGKPLTDFGTVGAKRAAGQGTMWNNMTTAQQQAASGEDWAKKFAGKSDSQLKTYTSRAAEWDPAVKKALDAELAKRASGSAGAVSKVAQQAGVTGAEKAAGTALAKGGVKATAGKLAGKLIPGVGSAIDAADAYSRWKEGDKTGAAIAGLGALGGLIPGVGTAISMGTMAANQARDYKAGRGAFAKDGSTGQAAQPAAAKKWPTTPEEIKAFQAANTDPRTGGKLAVDGMIGSHTYQALVQQGFKPPSNFAVTAYKTPAVAEDIMNFRQRLELIETKARISESLADEYHFDWDGNLYTVEGEEVTDELTKQVIWESVRDKEVVIDEAVWDKLVGGAMNAGRGVRDFFKGAAGGVKSPDAAARLAAKPATGTAKSAGLKTGAAIKKNPVKTAIAGTAAGAGLGYGLSGGKEEPAATTATPGGGGSGNGQAAQPATTEPAATPAATPVAPAGPTPEQTDLIKQIQDLMSQMADIEEQPVIAALQDAQATIDSVSKAPTAQPKKDEFAPTATQYGAFGEPPTGK